MVAEQNRISGQNLRLIPGGLSSSGAVHAGDLGCLRVVPDALTLEQVMGRSALSTMLDGPSLAHSIDREQSEEIFSSTGKLGREIRPFNRVYENRGYSDDSTSLLAAFRDMTAMLDGEGDVSRAIMRGLISPDTLGEILASPEGVHLEVAMDVSEFTGYRSWLIYIAKNAPERDPIVPVGEMVWSTEKDRSVPTEAPERRVQKVIDQGYRFVSTFNADQAEQVYDLWSDTFGWSYEEIENLRRRLHEGDERLWLSAVVDPEGNIVAAATAEKLDIPDQNGNLSLVENTEWRTKDGYQGKGLMTATLDMLNVQILRDLRPEEGDKLPLIYAECNYQSRSDRAGHGAGFAIPQRVIDGYLIPQVIVQNVNIGDNQPVPSDKLRDFTFMYLPAEIINAHYSLQQVEAMLGNLVT
ncbi:MAG: hypothetical protein ACD_37C00379G0001 [uncultured bacterium]|nr:MAG: hypothetical protein ACD_37C00379G0001 [uncultured bacterium]